MRGGNIFSKRNFNHRPLKDRSPRLSNRGKIFSKLRKSNTGNKWIVKI
jgi:hypothetical protein